MSLRTRTTAVAAALVLGSGSMLAGCGDDKDDGGDVTTNIQENVEDGADEVEDGADKAGDKIEDGADKAGDEIEDAGDDVKPDP